MSRYAICLVADEGYVVPSLVAGSQARVACPSADTDVFLFAMDVAERNKDVYRAIAAERNIQFVTVNRTVFGGRDDNSFLDEFFSNSIFTFGALGRLFLDAMLPEGYDQILYMDGDIQLNGSIEELVHCSVPDGTFLAVPDPKVFSITNDSDLAQRQRAYMHGLGLRDDELTDYFNSGVLRIARKGWKDIGLAAWTYLRANSEKCICHDQSALNAVARGARKPLSIRWNYPAYWNLYGLARQINPRVTHFMSQPKPWNGAFPPWSRKEHKVYLDLVRQYPAIAGELNKFDLRDTVRYALQQKFKLLDAKVHPQVGRAIASKVATYENSTYI